MIIEKPIIFFDLETTGVEVTKDRIVQIATIKCNVDGTREEKCYLINPTVSIPSEASEVHGIYDVDVEDKPTFDKYAKGLLSYFEGCDIGGYNSNSFDLPLLMAEFERCGLEMDLEGVSLVDAMRIERIVNANTLEDAYRRYTGKELEGAHDALNDVRATIAVLEGQCKRTELTDLDATQLDVFSQGDNPRVDLAGKLKMIDGEICWSFGKHKDKPVNTDSGYKRWFLGTGVPKDTREILLNV